MKNIELKFDGEFDRYVCVGDTIAFEHDGLGIVARVEYDLDMDIDDGDTHNPDQSVTGCDDGQQTRLLAARDAWFREEWFYCGIVLSASFNGVDLGGNLASLWAIEANYPGGDNSNLTDAANELLPEAVDNALAVARDLCAKLQGLTGEGGAANA